MRSQVFSLLVDNNPGVLSRCRVIQQTRIQYRQHHGRCDDRYEVYEDYSSCIGG